MIRKSGAAGHRAPDAAFRPDRNPRKRGRHFMADLYGKEMDFTSRYEPAVRRYVLATMPRSGSSLCSIRLWQSGQLGAPLEYLNFRMAAGLFERLGYRLNEDGQPKDAAQLSSYWNVLQRLRSSPNGVFGCKLFVSNLLLLAKRYPGFLSEIAPTHVVYLTRADLVGQAISYYRAQRTNAWFGGVRVVQAPAYDFKEIQRCLISICSQMAVWEKMFAGWGVVPLRLHYESLCRCPRRITGAVESHLDVRHDPVAKLSMPLLVRQADRVTAEWRVRFERDAANERFAQPA